MRKSKILAATIAAIVLASGGAIAGCGAHKHSYSDEWQSNETGHWHNATCDDLKEGDEGYTSGYGEHVWGDDDICDVCGYDRSTQGEEEETVGVYTVTLNVGDGTLASGVANTVKTSGGKIKGLLPEPTAIEHWQFDDWYDGEGTPIKEATYEFTADTTIYAKYVRDNGLWNGDGTKWYADLSLNTGAENTQYWLGGDRIEFEEDDEIAIYLNGNLVEFYVDSKSTCVDKSITDEFVSKATVTEDASFVIYLNYWTNATESGYTCEFTGTPLNVTTTDVVPDDCEGIEITVGTEKITLYVVDVNGDAINSLNANKFQIHAWNDSDNLFGAWDDNPTLAEELSIDGNVVETTTWIIHWNGGQSANFANILPGKSFVVYLGTDETSVEEFAGIAPHKITTQLPADCEAIEIEVGDEVITLYIKDKEGNPVTSDNAGNFQIHAWTSEGNLFGAWDDNPTLAEELSISATVDKNTGWIIHWNGGQTGDLFNLLPGKTYVLDLADSTVLKYVEATVEETPVAPSTTTSQIPEGCAKVEITDTDGATLTLYFVDEEGNAIGADDFENYCLYAYNGEIFGGWSDCTTAGLLSAQMTGNASIGSGFGLIVRWGENFATQTADIKDLKTGRTYVITLKAQSDGNSVALEYTDTRVFCVRGGGVSSAFNNWGVGELLVKTDGKNEYTITLDLYEGDQFQIALNTSAWADQHGAGYLVKNEIGDDLFFEVSDNLKGNIKCLISGNYTFTLTTDLANPENNKIDWVRNGDAEELELIVHYFIKGAKITDNWGEPRGEAYELKETEEGSGVYTMTITLEADDEFMFYSVNEDAVTGAMSSGTSYIQGGKLASEVTCIKVKDPTDAGSNFLTEQAGSYTFTYNAETDKLTVVLNADAE